MSSAHPADHSATRPGDLPTTTNDPEPLRCSASRFGRAPRAWRRGLATALLSALALAATSLPGSPDAAAAPDDRTGPKPTVVLVHGAWADGSSWDGVTRRLQRAGYRVVATPNPLRGVAADVGALTSYLRTVPGPVVLVGHSYGGFAVTGAAAASPNVRARVYVDAFIPDAGESVMSLSAKFPGSQLGEGSFAGVPLDDGTADLYVAPDRYGQIIANDLPRDTATALSATQRPVANRALGEPAQTPAASTLPTFALIGTRDNAIPVQTQEFMAKRVNATIITVPASHLSPVSQPDRVAELIRDAAAKAR